MENYIIYNTNYLTNFIQPKLDEITLNEYLINDMKRVQYEKIQELSIKLKYVIALSIMNDKINTNIQFLKICLMNRVLLNI